MSVLGTAEIYIPKGAAVAGIAIIGLDNKPIGGSPLKPVRPQEGDRIQVDFLIKPE